MKNGCCLLKNRVNVLLMFICVLFVFICEKLGFNVVCNDIFGVIFYFIFSFGFIILMLFYLFDEKGLWFWFFFSISVGINVRFLFCVVCLKFFILLSW